MLQVEQKYGDGAINALSRDLRSLIPEAKGLTPVNIYYCKRFYMLYSQLFEKLPQVVEKSIISTETDNQCLTERIFPQSVEIFKPLHHIDNNTNNLPLNLFAIPWGHHRTIIDYYEQEPQKALFYAATTLQHSWSRATLMNMMGDKGKANGLYEREGKAVNNFPATISLPTGELARELFNDPLNLSFVKLMPTYDENNLKQALVNHVNELQMSLGSGFAYIGKEYMLSVAGKEQFSDLLICRSKNNVFAQYCLEGYNQPIAISAYEGIQILSDNFNDTLPSIEQLEAEIAGK